MGSFFIFIFAEKFVRKNLRKGPKRGPKRGNFGSEQELSQKGQVLTHAKWAKIENQSQRSPILGPFFHNFRGHLFGFFPRISRGFLFLFLWGVYFFIFLLKIGVGGLIFGGGVGLPDPPDPPGVHRESALQAELDQCRSAHAALRDYF